MSNAFSNLFGGGKSSEDKKVEKYSKKLEEMQDRETPTYVAPEYEKMQGQQAGAWSNVRSRADDLQTADPELRKRQLASMSALDRIAEGGGLNLSDKANIAEQRMASASADRGRREAIQNTAAKQGMTGSGNTLLAQLASSQAATNQDSQTSMDIAGSARDRALDATIQSGQLAGDIRGQDFGEKSSKAAAQDAIAKFNQTGAMQADQANALLRQQTEQFNVQTGNAEQDAKNALLKQQFDDVMQADMSKADRYKTLMGVFTAAGDRKAQSKAALFSTVGTIGGAVVGGIYGGPPGAAAGGAAGGAVGGAVGGGA